MTDGILQLGKLGGGKNNRASRKRWKARQDSHTRRLPSIDLHKDANGKEYPRHNLNGQEILSQQIGLLQEYLWKVLEDPDVNVPFVVIHGEGNAYTLKEITIQNILIKMGTYVYRLTTLARLCNIKYSKAHCSALFYIFTKVTV